MGALKLTSNIGTLGIPYLAYKLIDNWRLDKKIAERSDTQPATPTKSKKEMPSKMSNAEGENILSTASGGKIFPFRPTRKQVAALPEESESDQYDDDMRRAA